MKINVIDDKGIEKNANIITSFILNKSKYVIYTFNEEDDTNSVRIYISELKINSNVFSFSNISNSDEWELVKNLMREMAKGVDNIDFLVDNFDIEVIDINSLISENDYTLATIKDSRIVKVSPTFIAGLYSVYKELSGKIKMIEQEPIVQEEEEIKMPLVVDQEQIESNNEMDDTSKKMKDIWEYSSMLQKKIAKDMENLNSKVVKLDGKRYYVKVKDPLYFKEKLDVKGNINDSNSELSDDELLKELEPAPILSGNIETDNNQSLFNQLEKELSGISDNFNKVIVKNQEKKAKITSEIEKRLQDVSAKEKELIDLESKLKSKEETLASIEESLKLKEEELMIANAKLEENIKSLTKYAEMVNSVILKKSEEE